MERRHFLSTSVAGLLTWSGDHDRFTRQKESLDDIRDQFPRLRTEVYLNGAGGTPLGAFAEAGIRRYLDYQRLGPDEGRKAYADEVWSGVRARYAKLVGADESEIGLAECTKAGEQIAIDSIEALRRGGNVVTNDMHFSGSLHNYEGLRRAGLDVRVVRADTNFEVSLDRMADAMDERTALVAVSLVSNVNGRIESVAELSQIAHARGALLYADIIQAAGAIPVDLHAMGVDVAACSSYKWLFGVHGAGFVYVRRDLQGRAIRDRLYPGHVRRTYAPWTEPSQGGMYVYQPPADATRYQPGHVSYVGYAAVYEALAFIEQVGVEAIRRHGSRLVSRLLGMLDRDRYRVLTPQPQRAPILSLQPRSMAGIAERLAAARVTIGIGGDMTRLLRISPAIYTDEGDIDRLAEVLNH